MTLALGIDPSLSCTGWAVVSRTDERLTLLAGGVVKSEDTSLALWERCRKVCTELEASAGNWRKDLAIIAVEMPQTKMFRGGKRSAATLPSYGVVVGAVAAMLETWRHGFNLDLHDIPLLTPSATEWAMGMPTQSKKERGAGARGKPGRIRQAEILFGAIQLEKTTAIESIEAVADAALLARWAILQEKGR